MTSVAAVLLLLLAVVNVCGVYAGLRLLRGRLTEAANLVGELRSNLVRAKFAADTLARASFDEAHG